MKKYVENLFRQPSQSSHWQRLCVNHLGLLFRKASEKIPFFNYANPSAQTLRRMDIPVFLLIYLPEDKLDMRETSLIEALVKGYVKNYKASE